MKDANAELFKIMETLHSQLEGLSGRELESLKPKVQRLQSTLTAIIDQIDIDTKMQQALVDEKITQQQYEEHKVRATAFVKEMLSGLSGDDNEHRL